MVDLKTSAPPLRTKDGSIRVDFVRQVMRAIDAGDVPALRGLVGDLHEADLGAVLEALETGRRSRLVELLGIDFDFTALTEVDDTVREEILDELPVQPSPKACATSNPTTRLPFSKTCPSTSRPRNPRTIAAAGARRAGAQSRLSGRFRRPAHADGIHRRAAGLECRPGHRLYARDHRSAGPFLQALRHRREAPLSRRGAARPTAAQQTAGADQGF